MKQPNFAEHISSDLMSLSLKCILTYCALIPLLYAAAGALQSLGYSLHLNTLEVLIVSMLIAFRINVLRELPFLILNLVCFLSALTLAFSTIYLAGSAACVAIIATKWFAEDV